MTASKQDIPKLAADIYDEDSYKKSQHYLKANAKFEFIQSTVMFVMTLGFILNGGFEIIDQFARQFKLNSLFTGITFISILLIISQLLNLPFSLYKTFIIEKKYGFNTTTLKTFVSDLIKGLALTLLIGLPILWLTLWFFETYPENGWLYCWISLTIIQTILMIIAPILIMPLFNKFEPIENGELRNQIESYAASQKFNLKGIYKMDGSKRSKKTNAFFTGFGPFKRIVLFDTLIEKHSTDEILTIIAHEMGHYKKRHIYKLVIFSIVQSFLLFWVLSLFLKNTVLIQAFGMTTPSIYASLVLFSIVFSPIESIISIVTHAFSRKFEYEADEYAIQTTGKTDAFISALKTLSKENLSNLTPHKLKIILDYSHPTVVDRIKAVSQK